MSRTLSLKAPRYPITSIIIIEKSIIINYLIVINYYTFIVPKVRRGKREKKELIIFELNLESEILRLEEELKNGRYKQGNIKLLKYMNQKSEL